MTTTIVKPYTPIGCPIPSKPTDWASDILPGDCYVQPKMNGVKALLSPAGEVYKKSGDRAAIFDGQFGEPQTGWIDGELWHPDLTLQEIAGLVNRGISDDETRRLEFWAVDLIHPEVPQDVRFEALAVIIAQCKLNIAPTHYCQDPLEAKNWYAHWASTPAYDGMIYRDTKAVYQFGKTRAVLKRKKQCDGEYICTGVTEGMGKFFGMLGSFQLKDGDIEFSCGGGNLTVADRKALWANPPIGSTLQIAYPYKSKEGIPQCPQFLRIRNDLNV